MRDIMTDEQKKANNKASQSKYYYKNKQKLKSYKRKQYLKSVDKFYTIYYLPEDNYIGLTSSLKVRIRQHKKNTNNYQVLDTFTDKRDALDTEKMLHEVYGFNGKNKVYERGQR